MLLIKVTCMCVFLGNSDITSVTDGPDKVRKSVSVDATPSVDEPEPGESSFHSNEFTGPQLFA